MREYRKEAKQAYPNIEIFHFPNIGVSVGIKQTGDAAGKFAVSIMGDGETKFRRKVAEYWIYTRFDCYQTLPCVIYTSTAAMAGKIANAVT